MMQSWLSSLMVTPVAILDASGGGVEANCAVARIGGGVGGNGIW